MAMYRHQSTGAIAELAEDKGVTVQLKAADTGEVKEVGAATFKRWWKPVEDEASPEEPTTAQNETEEPEAEETTTEETEAATGDRDAPEDEQETEDSDEGFDDEEIDDTEEADDETEETGETEKPADAPEQKPLALSEIVAKLEHLFDTLNRLYFDSELARPVITIQSTPKAYGHCSTKKIWRSGVERQGESYYEINIGAEYLNRASENTAATMLHEMVHLFCRENDIAETCQGGRYHNKLFKTEAEARDLKIEYNRAIGYSITAPTEELIGKLREAGFALEVPFARHTLGLGGPKVRRNKAKAYVCAICGQTVRSTAELNLICGDCNVTMTTEHAA